MRGVSVPFFALLALAVACTDSPVQPVASTLVTGLRDTYTAVMLPPDFVPAAINRSLMVVGSAPCSECPWPYRQPVRWTPADGTTALPMPADWRGDFSVRDLNDLGQVAGVATVGGETRAVRWEGDDTPQALGLAYSIPGSTINDEGVQAWVQVLGPFSNPTGFDIRLWSAGTDTSLGVLPFDRNENGDYYAPFRLKADGTLVWGYGRWVYRPDRGWQQYDFPADVISNASLRDANLYGAAVGTGFRADDGTQGYVWKRAWDRPEELEEHFLPEFLTSTRLMAGHVIYPGASAPPFQEAALRGHHGTVRLPVPPPPPDYALAWVWVFDLTDDGEAAVGSLVYNSTTKPPGPPLGGGVLWTRAQARPELALGVTAPSTAGALTANFAQAICTVPIAAASKFCADATTPLVTSRQRQ
jgi:hypothetical protein